MTGINHKQAQRYLRAVADGLLRENQRALLDAHLRECDSCRAEADELKALEARLKKNFQARWDAHDGPSRNVTANIHSQTRRIIMTNRINVGLRFLAGAVLFLVFGIILNAIFAQWRISPASVATSTVSPTALPAIVSATPQPYNGLIAFVSEKSGNPEIYTMQADGSHVTNLTKAPIKNYGPVWSPDGKRIAFINENNGDANIFIMNADGSEQTPLTNTSNNNVSFAWSPDGQKIAYSESNTGDPNTVSLSTVNADGKGVATLLDGQGANSFMGWSPDSKQIVYEKTDLQSGVGNTIYIVSIDGSSRQELAQHTTRRNSIAGWQDAQHFYTVSNNVDLWEIFRISTDGTPPEKIVSENSGIVTWFNSKNNLTYVTNNFESWTWYRIGGTNKTFLSTWPNYAAQCQKYQGERIMGGASNVPSPDGLYGLVDVYCDEGSTTFYIVSNDGSNITQLFNAPLPSQYIDAHWSPDGKYVVVDLGNYQTGNSDLYLIDIEKTLQDPSMRPIQLTADNAWKYDAVWQLRP